MADSPIFDLSEELLREGVSVCVLLAREIDNAQASPELLAYRKQAGGSVAGFWRNQSVSSHPAIVEYHRLHALFGMEKESPSPESLISFVRRNKDFTGTGPLVDCYNIVSAKTLISIGAHDLAKISLPISMRRLSGSDAYVPLNETESRNLDGEYGFVDAERRVICRMDVLQADFSKTTADTRDAVFILQDNRALKGGTLLRAAWMLSELLTVFCGSECELVYYSDPREV